ncbi:hypothetical protein HELRODRAFT_67348 [Helobdella robusta]|uniref:lysophospholipase n=1 Tax=Helobdella robusta TaxID=6412 RepID=T1FZ00_HELRO|nr:hypothetical protein HELRODRAFT_67348 [Helobdella robusta]ESN98891.1 hypothetical protein HELRODRAFT_67348 [Helobdella robusta]
MFFIVFLFKKCTSESHDEEKSADKYYHSRCARTKKRFSFFEADRLVTPRSSYADLRRGVAVDSYSLYNVPQRNYYRLPPEIIFMIENVKVFGHFSENILLKLCYHMQTKSLLAGEHLYGPCNPDQNIIVVQSGKVEILLETDNKTHTIKTVEKGESIYSLLNILQKFRKYPNRSMNPIIHGVAIQDTVLITLPIAGLKEVLDKHTDSLIDVIKIIGLRLQKVTFFTLKNFFGLTSDLLFENVNFHGFNHSKVVDSSSKYQLCFVENCDSDSSNSSHLVEYCLICSNKKLSTHFAKNNICNQCFLEASMSRFKKLLNLDPDIADVDIEEIHKSAGSVIIQEGTLTEKLYFLALGSVHLEEKTEASNDSTVIGFHKHDKLIGSLSILTGEASLFTYRAVEDCYLLAISKSNLFEAIFKSPDIIVELGASILNDLSALVKQVDFGLDWKHLEAGKTLYNQGDASNSAYVVLTGRLQSTVHEHSKSMLTGEYGRGDLVGLAETLTQSVRGSLVVAIRDTELACLSEELISFIKFCYPNSVTKLVQLLGQKILNSLSEKKNIFSMISKATNKKEEETCTNKFGKISTVAILSISSGINATIFCEVLKCALDKTETALLLNSSRVLNLLNSSTFESIPNYFLSSWLSQQEDQNDVVLFQCDNQITFWSKMCIRQADCVLIIADAKDNATIRLVEKRLDEMSPRARKYLLLLHDFDTKRPSNTVEWLKPRPWCSGHYHLRCHPGIFSSAEINVVQNVSADFCRLARVLTNKAIGLVLGGGAARGCAHVGVIKAMLDANIPIDMIGGTSIGSMVGAVWASETQYFQFFNTLQSWCKNKVGKMLFLAGDLTYPYTSFFTGRNFNNIVRETLGDSVAIEDLWLPYFCVTTDISVCKSREHFFGSLWRYVRSSMTLAGYMPPLCDPEDGHLLLDGVYTNNLPADIMHQQMVGVKTIFAVDVGRVSSENFSRYGDSLSGWWVLISRICPWMESMKVPNIFEVQSKVGYVLCEKQLLEVKSSNICEYLRPPIDKYGSLQFSKFDEIFLVGYSYAEKYFEEWKLKFNIPTTSR